MRLVYPSILALCALFLATSCSSLGTRHLSRGQRNKHLIFNPRWNSFPIVNILRDDWPSTIAYDRGGESIEYRETFIDIQTRSGGAHNDVPYRRFFSVRTGRARRR